MGPWVQGPVCLSVGGRRVEEERGFSVAMLPRWCGGKESACQCRRCKRHRFDPWVRNIPWKRKWQPTPVFFLAWKIPGKNFPGMDRGAWQAPWGCKELDTTEHIYTHD